MFGLAFLYSGSLWFLFIVEVSPSGWGWMFGLSRFLGYRSLLRCSGGWSWVSSLWSAMEFPVVSFEMVYGFGVTLGSCILMLRSMFLHCRRICVVCLALELIGSWVVVGFV